MTHVTRVEAWQSADGKMFLSMTAALEHAETLDKETMMEDRYMMGQTREDWGKIGVYEDGAKDALKVDTITGLLNSKDATIAALEVQLRSKEVEVWEAHVSETEAIKDLNDVCADYSRLVMRAAAINLDKAKAACEGDEPEEKSDG